MHSASLQKKMQPPSLEKDTEYKDKSSLICSHSQEKLTDFAEGICSTYTLPRDNHINSDQYTWVCI